MRQVLLATAFLLPLAPASALAQVVVNQAALEQLAGISAPPPVVEAEPVAVPVHHWHHSVHTAVAVQAQKPLAPTQAAARVVPPKTPKPAAAPVAKPAPPTPPKPPTPVSLSFAPGSADLPANATAALKPFCTATGQVAIDARAPTDPSDMSAAMRLSLARAMAIQAALTSCGVPAQNILPRALGNVPGQNEDSALIGSGGAK